MPRTSVNCETYPLLGSRMGKLSVVTKLSYGFGHVFNDLCAAVWFSYTLFYMQIILQMESSTAGILLMIGQVVDALATPVAGWAVDKFGCRKRWHFAGTLLVTVSFPLVFTICTACEDNELATIAYYTISIVLFQIGWATVQISHLSIIPKLTLNDSYRSELTAIRYTGAVCSSVIVYLITWAVLDTRDSNVQSIGPQDFYKFRTIVLIICGIGLISSAIFYVGVKSKETPEVINSESKVESNGSSTMTIVSAGPSVPVQENRLLTTAQIFMSPIVYQVSMLYVASRLYMILNLVYMPLYLEERESLNVADGGDLREAVATVPLLSFLASFLASLGLKYKGSVCGNKMAYLIGSTISIGSCLWIGFTNANTDIHYVYVVAVFIGIGSSTTMVTSLCLTAEMIGKNTEKGGSVYGVVTFTDKLICGIAVVIVEHLKCRDKADCPEYYRYVLAFVSGSAVMLGILILATLTCSKAQTITKHEDF